MCHAPLTEDEYTTPAPAQSRDFTMSKLKLIRSGGIIALATAMSRVLGFFRDIVIANFFGTAIYAQAFVVAFRIPNLLRDLVGEGAANAAFVPVFTDELSKKGKADLFKLAQVIFNILFWVLAGLTLAGILASPFIVKLIAPGFVADSEKFATTVVLTRVIFPFLMLVGLWAYAMGLLNTFGYFAAPAFGPCLLNLAMICCAAWFGENVFGLATGVLAGGVLQMAVQMPSLYRIGWRPRLTTGFSHPQAKKIGLLMVPRALGACVYQVNVFISTILASFSHIVGEGAVAALYYANRVWQLPLAIFGIALAQAALPTMSQHVASNDTEKLRQTLSFSLSTVFFILVPATAGLMVLAAPITRVLFERGLFTSYSTAITASALFFYALGLVAHGGTKVIVSAFYSLHDTATPLKTALGALALNIAVSLALMWPLKVGGLAAATSAAGILNFLVLYALLARRIGDFGTRRIVDSFVRCLGASLVMAVALKALVAINPHMGAVTLLTFIGLSIAVFLAAAYVFKAEELRSFIAWASKRR